MKPKAGSPPHTSTVLDVPLAVSARVGWELTQEDTRRRVCGCVSQGTGGGRTWSAADCQTALSASHTRLATMFPLDVRLFTGCVLFPRYRWTQGMVAGAKESEGGARHTGGGARLLGAADTRFVFMAAPMRF